MKVHCHNHDAVEPMQICLSTTARLYDRNISVLSGLVGNFIHEVDKDADISLMLRVKA